MKKTTALLAVLLAIFIVVGTTLVNTVYANKIPAVSMGQAEKEAQSLYRLGLFLGTNKGFALEEIPTRLQGVIMLVRMMGEEEAAKNCTYTHPFKDVPAWGDRYVAWAYAKKYTAGTSATTFSSTENMTAQHYLAFTIRALGYGNDTIYANTVSDAVNFGLIPEGVYKDASIPFLRADVVNITYTALTTIEKASGLPLYQVLINKGAIDPDIANSMFAPEEDEVIPDIEDDGNKEDSNEDQEQNNPVTSIDDILDFLGYGGSKLPKGDGISNPPKKYYRITNTNNNNSQYTAEIKGNQIIISVNESDYLTLSISLNEIIELKEVAPEIYKSKQNQVGELYIHSPQNNFSESITIPDLKYGYYFELVVEVEEDNVLKTVMDKIWVKGARDNWYFEGMEKVNSNKSLMEAADNVPNETWLKQRKPNEIKNEILSLIGEKSRTDYETGRRVYNWVSTNISYVRSAPSDSKTVLETREANCGGYVQLMADALAVYGIPTRMIAGEMLFGSLVDSFSNNSEVSHGWIEFYDSSSGRWIVCDPTFGQNARGYWFNITRDFASTGFKAVRYY